MATATTITNKIKTMTKKSKLKKAVYNLEARVRVLEKGSDFMQEINNIETESLLFEPTQPLTELPESWFIKITPENLLLLESWCGYNLIINRIVLNGKTWASFIPDGHTEISTEDFKRLVLKENVLEVGKWYKVNSEPKSIFRLEGINEKCIEAYGFDFKGIYSDKSIWFNGTIDKYTFLAATPEQIETALINEAKKRGYSEGIIVKSFLDKTANYKLISSGIKISTEFYNGGQDDFALRCGGACIYSNGIWAEIIEPAKEEIDWSKAGQYVYLENSRGIKIVITSGAYDRTCFSGTTIKNTLDDRGIGGYSDEWVKYRFEIYTGEPITLSN